MSRKKKFTLLIILATILYFALNYHFIIIGKQVRLLKKSELNLEYTVFSANGKSNRNILSIESLRRDGIGELLIKNGLMTEEEEELILQYLNAEKE